MESISHEFTVGGRPLRFETGEIAKQASGSVLVYYGGTTLLVTATVSAEPREGIDFFPLMVDFEERMYAAGKFPGGFFKREGRPSEEAILTGRRVDRTLRPMFPKHFRNDVQIVVTTLSCDGQSTPDVLSIISASAALSISCIPFPKLIAAARIAYIDGEFVVNPSQTQVASATMDLLVSGTRDYINMIEDQSHEVPEELLIEGLKLGHEEIKRIIGDIEAFAEKVGVPDKIAVPEPPFDQKLYDRVKELIEPRLGEIIPHSDKTDLYRAISDVKKETRLKVLEEYPNADLLVLGGYAETVVKKYAREYLLNEGVRVDGRGPEDIRPVSGRVGLLPRVHGSGLFTRGQTQVLSSVTLGTFGDRQRIDTLTTEAQKRFVHHYNFPPYSVGEVRFMRSPGRREIGHGALAEHAILPAIPDEKEFPYTFRVVSEVTESNASSSMASVCGSTLALLDAGVPLVRPVAGISTGLIYESDDHWVLLSDLSGFEDFNGDMDFKVAGTCKGITAIQLDVKIEGLTIEMIEQTLERARVGRLHILEQMNEVIPEARSELSPYAPTLLILKVHPEQIGIVIGPAGKTIRQIEADTGANVDIDEDGTVFVSGVDRDGVNTAADTIRAMTMEIEAGMVFDGKVVSIVPFGAFIELAPGRDGLLHISNIADHRIERVEDVLSIGDRVPVKVREVDQNGKVNLIRDDIDYSRKNASRDSTSPRRDSGRPDPRRRNQAGRGGDKRSQASRSGRDRRPSRH